MNLNQYLESRIEWLRAHRHPKTVNETRVAVEAFCDWLGSDPDIESITPKMVDDFEADKESSRRRQLVSNLCGLLRLYDSKKWPRRYKTTFALAMMRRDIVVIDTKMPRRGKVRTFSEFTALYLSQRSVSKGYGDTIAKHAGQYEKFCGSAVIRKICTEDSLNKYLMALEGQGSPATVRGWRRNLLTLWSAAADHDLCEYPRRRRIRRIKADPPSVECYSADEARALIRAARTLSGVFENGVPKRKYWEAMIRAGWDTGLRRGDLWQLERSAINDDGTFKITQHKTRKTIRRMFHPETLAAVLKIDATRPLQWPLTHEWSFGFNFQRIIELSGVDKGSFKWLRRACGSHVEADHPGAGCKALGNTAQIFRTHYDAELATEILMPPRL